MRTAFFCIVLAVLAGAGCVSKKKAELEARQAYLQGQEQAAQNRARIQEEQGPSVFLQGPVRNPIVPWKEGLKLSQAIVTAEYTAFMNPLLIRVLRDGQVAGEFKGIDLLHHEDMELEAGDMVIIAP